MTLDEMTPIDALADRTNVTPLFYLFVLVPTLLGAAHHVDHIIRGNHVGWPVTAHVNEFTYSLGIYPLLSISLLLAVYGLADARYWTGFFLLSAGMLAYFHISPWAIEPPQDVMGPYADPVVGYLAFAILLALIASTVLGATYAGVLHFRGDAR